MLYFLVTAIEVVPLGRSRLCAFLIERKEIVMKKQLIITKDKMKEVMLDTIRDTAQRHQSFNLKEINYMFIFDTVVRSMDEGGARIGVISRFVLNSQLKIKEIENFEREHPVAAKTYSRGYFELREENRCLRHIVRSLFCQYLCIEVHKYLEEFGIACCAEKKNDWILDD